MAQTFVTCTKCGRSRTEKHMEQAVFLSPPPAPRAFLDADAPRRAAKAPAWRCMARTSCASWAKTSRKQSAARAAAESGQS